MSLKKLIQALNRKIIDEEYRMNYINEEKVIYCFHSSESCGTRGLLFGQAFYHCREFFPFYLCSSLFMNRTKDKTKAVSQSMHLAIGFALLFRKFA